MYVRFLNAIVDRLVSSKYTYIYKCVLRNIVGNF